MILELQFKIKQNQNYQKFIRENSIWYKYLNRDPTLFREFEEAVKDKYKLRVTDKINNAIETFDMIQKVLSTLN